jgi:hypothetical protein
VTTTRSLFGLSAKGAILQGKPDKEISMLASLRSHLSYANVIATVALFVALGGSAYAASALPRNSVGTAQLKPGAVTRSKIASGAFAAGRVRPTTLRLSSRSATVPVSTVTSTPFAATAVCPKGRLATGGGAIVASELDAYVNDTGPVGRRAWKATALAYSGGVGTTLTVYVICAAPARATS